MQTTIQTNKWDAESQVDSQPSVIATHDTPRKNIDEFEKAETIGEIFKPDFTVYVQKHPSTQKYPEITKQNLKNARFETQELL